MKVFAIASIPQGVSIEQIQQLLPKEVPATLKLQPLVPANMDAQQDRADCRKVSGQLLGETLSLRNAIRIGGHSKDKRQQSG